MNLPEPTADPLLVRVPNAVQEMPAGSTWIPASGLDQAMDWALVLASQDIPARIESVRVEASNFHGLIVSTESAAAAGAAIAAFQRENRFRNWRARILQAGPWLSPWVLIWVLILSAIHLADAFQHGRLSQLLAADSNRIDQGEVWRFFTAMLLHGDLAHLASNLAVGTVFVGLAMAAFPIWFATLGLILSGAFGNLLSWSIHAHPFVGVGASGMVFGALGLLTGRAIRSPEDAPGVRRKTLAGFASGFFLLILYGTSPSSDLVAHFGGFFGGLLYSHLRAPQTETRVPEELPRGNTNPN